MSRSNVAMLISMAMAAVASPAFAQSLDPSSSQAGSIDGFVVAGKGMVAARPNRLEIDLEISAASELSADAIVKYRDAKKRLHDAFTTLKMSNVTIEERGLNIDQKGQVFNPYMMDMPPARRGKVEVQLKRKLVVTCSGIRDMQEEALLQLVAKLLDVAQDAGGKVGGQPDMNPYSYRYGSQDNGLVRFILDDFDALQEKAYQAAILDAKARAGRLAKLSGVELGRVAGVRETLVSGEKAAQATSFSFYGSPPANDDEVPRKRLESQKFQEIPVKVELQVRFELAAAPKAERREGNK